MSLRKVTTQWNKAKHSYVIHSSVYRQTDTTFTMINYLILKFMKIVFSNYIRGNKNNSIKYTYIM